MTVLNTERLRMEPFQDHHFEGLHAIDSDPEVMRYISGKPDTREDTAAVIARVKARWAEWGYSWWAFVEKDSRQIIGSGCIQHLARDKANQLEIGWRLRPDRWHRGFASEAAQAMVAFAFDILATPRLCAVCHPDNKGSARVMQRLGMSYRGSERWYEMDTSVYEITRARWQIRNGS